MFSALASVVPGGQGAQDIFKDMQVRFIVATEKFSLSKAVDIATSST